MRKDVPTLRTRKERRDNYNRQLQQEDEDEDEDEDRPDLVGSDDEDDDSCIKRKEVKKIAPALPESKGEDENEDVLEDHLDDDKKDGNDRQPLDRDSFELELPGRLLSLS